MSAEASRVCAVWVWGSGGGCRSVTAALPAEALLAAARAVPSGVLVRAAGALEYDLEGDWRRKPLIEPAHLAIAENLASCGRGVLLRLARHVDSAHKGEGVCP